MSDPKDPFDPFGQSERTVFRPNPGGRRPAAPPPQQPAQPAPPPQHGWGASPPAPAPSYDPIAQNVGPANVDAWAERASQGRQQLPQEVDQHVAAPVSAPVVVRRDIPKPPNENPIMAAAGPVLMVLGRLRIALMQVAFPTLMELVAQAIQNFEAEVRSATLTPEQVRTAKYIVCATADDIVQNIPDQDRQLWTQYSMLARFFGDRLGGVKFFEDIERVKADPVVNLPLLELQHACLALGFQGQYRASAGGAATLQNIQRNLYETIRRVKSRAGDLSPRWQGQDLANMISRVRIPFWAVASLAALLLVAMFLILRSLLNGGTDAVVDDMSRIFPATDVVIQSRAVRPTRAASPPPTVVTGQLERIRAGLKAEIDAGQVSVDSTPTGIFIRVGTFTSFAPGKAAVIPQFIPLAKRITAVLEKEPGPIRVVGHTDNTPIGSGRFASNHELSIARSKAVAEVMGNTLSDKKRLETDGKGETAPVTTNGTVEGRARNRRVDVSIPHEK